MNKKPELTLNQAHEKAELFVKVLDTFSSAFGVSPDDHSEAEAETLLMFTKDFNIVQGDAGEQEWLEFRQKIKEMKQKRDNEERQNKKALERSKIFAPVEQLGFSTAEAVEAAMGSESEEDRTALFREVIENEQEAIQFLKQFLEEHRQPSRLTENANFHRGVASGTIWVLRMLDLVGEDDFRPFFEEEC